MPVPVSVRHLATADIGRCFPHLHPGDQIARLFADHSLVAGFHGIQHQEPGSLGIHAEGGVRVTSGYYWCRCSFW